MLKKLFRHDFHALARVLFPIQIGVLAGGLLATILARLAIVFDRGATEVGNTVAVNGLALTASVSGIALLVTAIFASMLVTTIIECLRFYRNLLGDEGYLTFTLPVSNAQIIGSKLLAGVLWMVINFVCICVAGLLFLVFGTAENTLMNADVLDILRDLFTGVEDGGLPMWLFVPETIVWGIAGAFAQLMKLYFAIIVGGQVAKKNKLLAAIGMYLVINFCVSIAESIFMALTGLGVGLFTVVNGVVSEVSTTMAFGGTMLWSIIVSAILTVAFFFWSRRILNKNLNLQ